MHLEDVVGWLKEGTFFNRLEEAAQRAEADSFWPWLRLLRTDAIESWSEKSDALRRVISQRRTHGEAALELLLERHILDLNSRRDPRRLEQFWARTAPQCNAVSSFWSRLPTTLDAAHGVALQERHFARLLRDISEEIVKRSGPTWAVKTLERIAATREEPTHQPTARVVFAWSSPPTPACRSGVVVDFRLLAKSLGRLFISDEQVFDETFRRSLEEDIRNRIGDLQLRRIEHEWGFLPEGSLTSTSGTLALWVALQLASPGQHFRRRPWALPPWVVISATLDRNTPVAGGQVGAIDGLTAKLKVLAEEGVRVLVLADETDSCDPPSELFSILKLSGNACDLGEELLKGGYLLQADLSSFESDLLPSSTSAPDAGRRARERRAARPLHIVTEDDYLTPDYAFREIDEAIKRLKGKGYIHLTASAGQGKSIIVRALHERREGTPQSLGKTLSYHILRGEPNSFFFIKTIANQVRALDRGGLSFVPDMDELSDVPSAREALCGVLEEARQVACQEGEPLILAIDGVDELPMDDKAESGEIPLLFDLLPVPPELPENCYVLFTSRPELPAPVRRTFSQWDELYGPFVQSVNLPADDPAYQDLLESHLVCGLGEDIRHLVPAIIEKSDSSFLYVRLFRDWLSLMSDRGQALAKLKAEDLPKTREVFAVHLDELAQFINDKYRDAARFDHWHRQILLLIAVADEPVYRECLSFWLADQFESKDDPEHLLNCALTELAPLLRTQLPQWLRTDVQYAVAHTELADWLIKNDHPDWRGASLNEATRRIVKQGRSLFAPDGSINVSDGEQMPLFHYHFWHLPTHLIDIDDLSRARDFLESSWHDKRFDSLMDAYRSTLNWSEMLRLSRLRTCQSAEAFKPASDAPDSVDAAMSFVLAVGFPLLYEIEAYVGLGRTDKALELLESLPRCLDAEIPESEEGREKRLLDLCHPSDEGSPYKRFRHLRLDVERYLWYVRIWLRRGEVKKAKESVIRALNLLMGLSDVLSVRDVGEDMAIWRVLTYAETVKHWGSLNREPTELPDCLALNLHARKVVGVLVEEIPAHSAHDEPRIIEASAQLDCDRAELLLRTAEDGEAPGII